MPFSSEDASKHKKDISSGSKSRWASIANEVLRRTNNESLAIRMANGATRQKVVKKLVKGS